MSTCKLKFDRRKRGGYGLCAAYDCGAINARSSAICAGDLLPPQPGLPDVATYPSLSAPRWIRFWRRSRDSM
eukprot:8210282-Pyramimonas_sp.AAC.1